MAPRPIAWVFKTLTLVYVACQASGREKAAVRASKNICVMEGTLSSRLTQVRRARGLSQGELARAAGVSRQAIGAIETGRVQPSVVLALSLARALSSSVEELFGAGDGPQLEAELSGRGVSGHARAAVAVIDGRIVARRLDAREASMPEPAGALIASASNGVAQLEPIARRTHLESTIFLAGCEPGLGLLGAHVNANAGRAAWFGASNRDALADLCARRVHVAALHGSAQELERMLQRVDAPLDLYELGSTEEGWIIAHGNPKKLRGARDLGRAGLRIANRITGSAARALLDAELRRAGVQSATLAGYRQALDGHADVARAIAFGYADIGIGVAGVADAFKLSFIPLRKERCVLAMRRSDRAHAGIGTLIATLRSSAFRRDLAAFGPYDVTRLGEAVSK